MSLTSPGLAATQPILDVDVVRARFAGTEPFTVGLEEEVLLVDALSGQPAPVALEVTAGAGDPSIKPELPAAQVELVTPAQRSAAEAVDRLAAARRALVAACGTDVVPVAAAVHPLAVGPAVLSSSSRGRSILSDYRDVATRQLVGSIQVHVPVGDADLTLAVHNSLRGYLPEIAALAAAAPFHEGRDTGLASIRPLICGQLPRQGIPPAITSWEDHVDDLRWGAAIGAVADPGRWWWELRPHLAFGTLEVRVPDVQPTVADTLGVVSFVHALICHLAAAHRDGMPLDTPPTWRIEENRWSALRDGVHGRLADLRTGELLPTRERLLRLVARVESHAPAGLDSTRALVADPALDRLRRAGRAGATRWLAEAFLS